MIAAINEPLSLCQRIAAIARERGITASELSRLTLIQRGVIAKILTDPAHQIRSSTVKRIADALELTVHQLCYAPLQLILHPPAPGETIPEPILAPEPVPAPLFDRFPLVCEFLVDPLGGARVSVHSCNQELAEDLTPYHLEILRVLTDKPMTASRVARLCGRSASNYFRDRLAELIQAAR